MKLNWFNNISFSATSAFMAKWGLHKGHQPADLTHLQSTRTGRPMWAKLLINLLILKEFAPNRILRTEPQGFSCHFLCSFLPPQAFLTEEILRKSTKLSLHNGSLVLYHKWYLNSSSFILYTGWRWLYYRVEEQLWASKQKTLRQY